MASNDQRPHLKKIMTQVADKFGMAGFKEWLSQIEDPLDYEDLAERQAVIRRNTELMQHKMAILQRFSPINSDYASQYVANEGNFSHDEWSALEQIKQDLTEYEQVAQIGQQQGELAQALEGAQSQGATEHKKKTKRKKMGSYRGWIPS